MAKAWQKMLYSCCLLTACLTYVLAKSQPDKQDRVHHGQDLSDHPHDDKQDFQYDHDAFLGKEEDNTFEELFHLESKERLGKLVDQIDRDGDGFVTQPELKDWIKHAEDRHNSETMDKTWKMYDKNNDGHIAWEEFKNVTYNYFEGEASADVENKERYMKMLERSELRFKAADKDGDLIATREEFRAFLHPEQFDYMKDLIVSDTMESMDKDKDGFVGVDEYIENMYSPESGEPEPDWVKDARQRFFNDWDLNKDGEMDREEIRSWIHPPDYDNAEEEAKLLLFESDKDKDSKLSPEELIESYQHYHDDAKSYNEMVKQLNPHQEL